MEGVALQARLMLDGMLGLEGAGKAGAIRLIGGATRNRLFLGIKANAYGRPVIVVEETEATALGAALLGGIAAGVFPDIAAAVAGLNRREFTVEPDADAARYDAIRTEVFAPATEAIRATNGAIHRVLG
jgi:xylulokinase